MGVPAVYLRGCWDTVRASWDYILGVGVRLSLVDSGVLVAMDFPFAGWGGAVPLVCVSPPFPALCSFSPFPALPLAALLAPFLLFYVALQ